MWLKVTLGALLGAFTLTNAINSNVNNCIENNGIQLCQTYETQHVLALKSETVCPENYHICNMEDKDELVSFQLEQTHKVDSDESKLKNSCYATRISSFNTRCNDCRGDSIENSKMVLLGDCSGENNVRSARFLKGTYEDVLFMTTPDVCCREPESTRDLCYENVNNNIRNSLQVECSMMNIDGGLWRVCDFAHSMLNADCNEMSREFPECAGGFKIPINCTGDSTNGDTQPPIPSPEPTREPVVTDPVVPSESAKPSPEPTHEPWNTDPVVPSESVKPSPEPVRPSESAKPSPEPTHEPWNTDPVVPSESAKPSPEPVRPSESAKPSPEPTHEPWNTDPVVPSESAKPSPEPVRPSESAKPSPEPTHEPWNTDPVVPSESAKPSSEPVRPSESAKPSPEPTREPDVVHPVDPLEPTTTPKPSDGGDNGSDGSSGVVKPTETSRPSPEPTREPDVLHPVDPLEPTATPKPSEGGDVKPTETSRPSPEPTREPDVVHPVDPADDGIRCCEAMTVECEACRQQITIEELCRRMPSFEGCHDKPNPSPSPEIIKPNGPSETIKPTPEHTTAPEPQYYCTYEDRRVPNGWFSRVDDCNVCKCHEGEITCVDKCDRDDIEDSSKPKPQQDRADELEIIRPVEEELNCLEVPMSYFNYQVRNRCQVTQDITGVACCANKCSVENCASCFNEKCKECVRGFNLLSYGTTSRCVRIRPETIPESELPSVDVSNSTSETSEGSSQTSSSSSDAAISYESICEASQYIKHGRFGEVECMECINGEIHDEKCVCHEDFYGKACEMNCRYELCSGHGTCRGRECNCDEGYEGRSCELKVDGLQCENGVYDDRENKCVCKYGFAGELCERSIPCYNGRIVDDKCLCEEGYSGRYCNLVRPVPSRVQEQIQSTIVREQAKPCVNGFTEGDRCVCVNGWKGESCNENMCLHGRYNITSESCVCRDGWTGERCDVSCEASCSFNGNICNDNGVCVCYGDWSGNRCNVKEIKEERASIDISGYNLQIERPSNETKLDVQVVDCFSDECIPIKLTFERAQSSEPSINRLLQERDGKVRVEVDEDLILENATLVLVNSNDNNVNYTSETNVVLMEPDVEGSFFVYSLVQQIDYAQASGALPSPEDGTPGSTIEDDNSNNGATTGSDDTSVGDNNDGNDNENTNDNTGANNQKSTSDMVNGLDNRMLFGGASVIFVIVVVGAVFIRRRRTTTPRSQIAQNVEVMSRDNRNIGHTNPLRTDVFKVNSNYYKNIGPSNV